MSEIIKFNTEKSITGGEYSQVVDVFSLVDEFDPVLTERVEDFDFSSPPVDPQVFASQLVETCKLKGGFGLSANQCGYKYRVFVMGAEDEYVACFNPKIISQSEKQNLVAEGCLSFPMLVMKISRPESISVEYLDFNGKKHEASFSGMTSHVFQHELDHLNGICYTERAKPMSLKMGLKKRTKINKLVERYNSVQKKIQR